MFSDEDAPAMAATNELAKKMPGIARTIMNRDRKEWLNIKM
jgi:hypothetical protein